MVPLLELDAVTVIRGGRPVLRGASLVIRPGESVAIVGPNGSGKSTLLKLLTREVYPAPSGGGTMRVRGRERWNVSDLRRAFGIVTNDLARATLDAESVLDVVLSGFFASHGISANHAVDDAMRAAALAKMRALDIESLASRRPTEISSGQARRMLVARALVRDPEALVLDEPGDALDPRGRAETLAAIRGLARAGTTLVIATHDFAEIVPEIGRIVFMREGAFVRDGPRAELLRPSELSRLFDLPAAECPSCGAFAFEAPRGRDTCEH